MVVMNISIGFFELMKVTHGYSYEGLIFDIHPRILL